MITQNIDRLHARAGTQSLVEVHGSIAHSSCLVCGLRYELEVVRARHEGAGDGVPRCECGQPLKPDVVLFGELLPFEAMARAERLAAGADLMLCIGSSLEVYPVAALPDITLDAGGQIAILTQGPTPLDRRAAVRMRGDVVEELESVLAALGLRRSLAWPCISCQLAPQRAAAAPRACPTRTTCHGRPGRDEMAGCRRWIGPAGPVVTRGSRPSGL